MTKFDMKVYQNLIQKTLHRVGEPLRSIFLKELLSSGPEDDAEFGRTGCLTGALGGTEQGKAMSPGTRHDYLPN